MARLRRAEGLILRSDPFDRSGSEVLEAVRDRGLRRGELLIDLCARFDDRAEHTIARELALSSELFQARRRGVERIGVYGRRAPFF